MKDSRIYSRDTYGGEEGERCSLSLSVRSVDIAALQEGDEDGGKRVSREDEGARGEREGWMEDRRWKKTHLTKPAGESSHLYTHK